jgi:hypothetical protein
VKTPKTRRALEDLCFRKMDPKAGELLRLYKEMHESIQLQLYWRTIQATPKRSRDRWNHLRNNARRWTSFHEMETKANIQPLIHLAVDLDWILKAGLTDEELYKCWLMCRQLGQGLFDALPKSVWTKAKKRRVRRQKVSGLWHIFH